MRRTRSSRSRISQQKRSLLEGYMIEGLHSDEKVVVGSEWVNDRENHGDDFDDVKLKVTHVEMVFLPVKKSFIPLVAYEWKKGSKSGKEYQAGVEDISNIFSTMRRVK